MTTPASSTSAVIRALERALTRRRVLGLERALWFPLTAVTVLAGAIVFWQVRVPLDGMVRARGPGAGVAVLAGLLAALASLGVAHVHVRHRRALRDGPAGPAWLALPLPVPALARHLAWNDAWHALPTIAAAAAVVVAGLGIVPVLALLVLAAGFALALALGARAACALAVRIESGAATVSPAQPALLRALTRVPPAARPERTPAARWRSGGAARTLLANDLARARRPGELRRRLACALVLLTLSGMVWLVPVAAAAGPTLLAEPNTAHALALVLGLIAAAAFGEWLIATVCGDPPTVVGVLPLGLRQVWAARILWCVLFAAGFAGLQALLAWPLAAPARALFIAGIGPAMFLIALLALHYGITLHPHADLARRVYVCALGLALATSVILPLAGWIVLVVAVAHSGRRLRRWTTAEAGT
jgi:hypothetical protein